MTEPYSANLSEGDYRNIEDELEGTEKGRRFLRAYLERNRASETQSLLRSIARLHRVTIGQPGFPAEAYRDVKDVLRNVVQLRANARICGDDAELSMLLLSGLHEIEACLMALSEAWEEHSPVYTQDELNVFSMEQRYATPMDRNAKLYGELSSLFASDIQFGPADVS